MQINTQNTPYLFLDYTQKDISENISFVGGKKTQVLVIGAESSLDISFSLEEEHTKVEVFLILPSQNKKTISGSIKGILAASHTHVDIYMLSLLGDEGIIQVDGGVDISPGVTKVEGHLLEENIILGKNIKIKTLPMLDVHSNDVVASHGCRIHKVDPENTFYMQAKGISQKAAEQLILEGYLHNIFDQLSLNEETQQQLKTQTLSAVQ